MPLNELHQHLETMQQLAVTPDEPPHRQARCLDKSNRQETRHRVQELLLASLPLWCAGEERSLIHVVIRPCARSVSPDLPAFHRWKHLALVYLDFPRLVSCSGSVSCHTHASLKVFMLTVFVSLVAAAD